MNTRNTVTPLPGYVADRSLGAASQVAPAQTMTTGPDIVLARPCDRAGCVGLWGFGCVCPRDPS